jgi:predicted nucleic acid-binding protein
MSSGTPAYFADTSFWLALFGRRDEYHPRALLWQRWLLRHHVPLVTTEPVLWEWLNAMAAPATRQQAAVGYRRCHEDEQIRVTEVDPVGLEAAVRLYESRSDKAWSLTDCFSFTLMHRYQMTDALTTDHHFEQAGFRALLRHEPPS